VGSKKRCKIKVIVLCLLFLPGLLVGQSAQPDSEREKWRILRRLCGRVEYVKNLAAEQGKDVPESKRKSLRNVELELYPRELEGTCCEGLKMTSKVITGRTGKYDFNKVEAGKYWVVARWNDKVFHLPMTLSPERPSVNECLKQGFQIDSNGVFDQWVEITVD
jgi:hypothetical protein